METAFLSILASLPRPNAEQEVAWSRAGQMLYAANGVTTAQEGATYASELALMQRAAAGANIIDLVAYPFITDFVVAPLDQMFVVWTAVNRISRSGVVIGPDQRITPMER